MSLLLLFNSLAAVSEELVSRIEAGLGGRYLDVLVDASDGVGCWPLWELKSARARNLIQPLISQTVNHGTWSGTGTTRGARLTTIPDGLLGATFDGNGYVQVADDGDGYRAPGDSSNRTLSLAAGDMDVVALIKTSTDDATLRCIVQKQETNSAGDGWHVAIQNAAIEFFLRVNGVTIFSFQRGSVADGVEHTIHCHYDTVNTRARIYIDGVQSGAEVTGLGTEPEVTSANLRIGAFNDGAGGFIGTIATVMVGRNGNADLSGNLELTRDWTDISSDVRTAAEPIQVTRGWRGADLLRRIADPSVLTFALSNHAAGVRPEGYYTPGHANARAGWQERVPIRWQLSNDGGMTWVTQFHGFVEDIRPALGKFRSRHVSVSAKSWLQHAMLAPLGVGPAKTTITSDDVLRYAIDRATRPPLGVSFDVGDAVLPFALDDLPPAAKLYQELAQIVSSEFGALYETRDGTLVFESRTHAFLVEDVAADWTEATFREAEADRSIDAVINLVRATAYPRKSGSAGTVLASMPSRLGIPPGETKDIELRYRDPDQEVARVGASTVITPVATTDYTMNAAADGSGANLTASASLTLDSQEAGGAASIVRVTNTGTQLGWFQTQIRGTPLRHFQPVVVTVRDEASIRGYDAREVSLDLRYQADLSEADSIGRQILALARIPFTRFRSGLILGKGAADVTQLLDRELGDHITAQETMAALSEDERYVIRGLTLTLSNEDILSGEYHCVATSSGVFEIIGVEGFAELGEMAIA